MVRESNHSLLKIELCIDTGFDNFQVFSNKKFQRDNTSATCRFAKRSIPVNPSVCSVLQTDSIPYQVIAILQYTTYNSLLKAQSRINYIHDLISWPTIGWTVISLYETEAQ